MPVGGVARPLPDAVTERLVRQCVSSALTESGQGIGGRELRQVRDALALRVGRRTFLLYTTEDYLVQCAGDPVSFTGLGYAETSPDQVSLTAYESAGLRGTGWLSVARVGEATGRVAFVSDGQEVEALRSGGIAAAVSGKPEAVRLYAGAGRLRCEIQLSPIPSDPVERREQYERCYAQP